MSLQTRLQALITAVGADIKALQTGKAATVHTHSTADVTSLLSTIRDSLYPVGSIYTSVNNVNPGTQFGGTWVAFGAGRMPIGVNAADTRFDAAEETGGTDTITDSMLPDHSHAIGGSTGADTSHTHGLSGATLAEDQHQHHVYGNTGGHSANHTHSMTGEKTFYFAGSTASATTDSDAFARGAASGRAFSNAIINAGSTAGASVDHSHLSNFWTTQNAGQAHSHGLSGNTNAGSSHSHTLPASTGSKNGPANDPFLPPYIAVYMWKRTA